MKMYILILLALFASCKKRDKVYNLLTNNGTFKAWDYIIEDSNDVKGGIVFSKDSTYSFYYTYYNDSIKIINKTGLHGYANPWQYMKDSLYKNGQDFEFKILYIEKDSLVIKYNGNEASKHIEYFASKRQEMPMDYEEYKKIYPRPPVKWEVFGIDTLKK